MNRANQFWVLGVFFLFLTSTLIGQGTSRLLAFKAQQNLLNQNANKNIFWQSVGPDNVSGRCTDVEGVGENPEMIYAAFATGGVWKTMDGGLHWNSIFDKQGSLSIGDIALAKSNSDVLYVGTGEANIFRASLPGIGLFKSVNGGKSFEHVGLSNAGTIARIVVHPENPDKVYVAVSGNEWTENEDRGVYFTENGGKTWKRILYESPRSGCIDLVMDPSNPRILYASFWSRIRKRWSDPQPEDGDYLYKSTDGGNSWEKIVSGLPSTAVTGRIGLAISISNPQVLYAFVDDHSIKRAPLPNETDSYERKVQKVVEGGAIYKSNDAGAHWEKKGEIHDFFKPFSGTYGWVFSQIRVDPKDENKVYALGVSMGKSMDGGKTWEKFEPLDEKSEYIHGDNHALWINPTHPDHIILGNDGGVSITKDGGKIWDNQFDKMITTQFYTLSYDYSKPFRIFGSVQDEGTMMGVSIPDSSGGFPWQHVPGGEGTQIQNKTSDPNIYFASSYYGRLMKVDLSKKGKGRETHFTLFDVGRIDSLRGEWLAGTLVSKFDEKVVYHGLQHLYRSKDEGANWERISPDLTNNDKKRMGVYPYLISHQAITCISEGQEKGLIYVGTDDGNIWLTRNDGKTWKNIGHALPSNKHIAKIIASIYSPSRVYAVINDRRSDNNIAYIFKSEDYGITWKLISDKLPQSPVNVLIEGIEKDILWCGTDMGIYKSKGLGEVWEAMNGNLPSSVSVTDMFIHPRDQKLVISTYGRGVYILKNN